jgi:hypothetical protein
MIKKGIDKLKVVIAENSTIELGVLLTIISLCAWPMYKAIAELENHSVRLNRVEKDVSKIDKISEDVGYIRGVIETMERRK